MIQLTPSNIGKHPKIQKLAVSSQLQTYQILKNDDQMLILCLSYFITTLE